jgi:hypothetical protein
MAMAGWDWNAMYLTCFGVGLVLSFLAFFGGALHLHVGHLHLHGHGVLKGAAARGQAGATSLSPLNGFTLMAFLCWFGGTGYLMHRGQVFGAVFVLLFSVISGVAGSSLVFWFLTRVLMPRERTLEPEDTEMTGVIGHISSMVPARGFGEMLYVQNGARRGSPVRSDDGTPIERGTEVIVMRYERGVAYVRRWDEFEHGLMKDGPVRNEEQKNGPRETARPE